MRMDVRQGKNSKDYRIGFLLKTWHVTATEICFKNTNVLNLDENNSYSGNNLVCYRKVSGLYVYLYLWKPYSAANYTLWINIIYFFSYTNITKIFLEQPIIRNV